MNVAICLLAASYAQLAIVRSYVVDAFQEKQWSTPAGDVLNYRLLVPPQADSAPQPLIMWFHGAGESGRDNVAQLTWIDRIFPSKEAVENADFYVLALQCPLNHPWYGGRRVDQAMDVDMCGVAITLAQELVRDGKVDADRIYAAGVSSGAAACWEVLMLQPDLFAAAAPFSSAAIDHRRLAKIAAVPIWAFNNDEDQSSPRQDVQRAVDALNERGGRAHLTVFQGSDHDAWTSAFREHDLLDWLLDQQKDDPGRAPGAYRLGWYVKHAAMGWTVSEALLQLVIVYLGAIIFAKFLKSSAAGVTGLLFVLLALGLLWQLSGIAPWGLLTYLDVRTWAWLDDLWHTAVDLAKGRSTALVIVNVALLAVLVVWRSRQKSTAITGASGNHAEVTNGHYAR